MGERTGRRTSLELKEVPEEGTTCPSCGQSLPVRRVPEAWVRVDLEGGWVAAYRVLVRSGHPIVGEVRVFPGVSDSGSLGRWSTEVDAVPGDGVPGKVLRSLRVTDGIEGFTDILKAWDRLSEREDVRHIRELDQMEPFLELFGIERPLASAPRRPGRAGRSEWFYALWALGYASRLRAGSPHPIKDLAEDPPVAMGAKGGTVSEASARAIVHQARGRGFLTPAPRGRPGGELTPAALAVLKRVRDQAAYDRPTGA